MKIIVDIMGADKTPEELLCGVCMSRDADYAKDVEFVVVGEEKAISRSIKENKLSLDRISIVYADKKIDMTDHPMAVVKEKRDSSMGVALDMLAHGEGDALVSSGNTGALYTGATLIVKRIVGVRRPAIGSILPFSNPLMLIDSGANIEVTNDDLLKFAIMGDAYMKAMYGVVEPRVGLLNNGAEDTKGTPMYIEANAYLKSCNQINYIGNVEGNTVQFGACDVVVTDGFTGNIMLKSAEGMAKLMSMELKKMFVVNIFTRLAAVLMNKQLKNFKRRFDPASHGGAPFLGFRKMVIKSHGSSGAEAFSNSIRQSIQCVRAGVVPMITEEMARIGAGGAI